MKTSIFSVLEYGKIWSDKIEHKKKIPNQDLNRAFFIYLYENEPINVEPENRWEVDGHRHDGEQALVEHELVHQVAVDVQHDKESELNEWMIC